MLLYLDPILERTMRRTTATVVEQSGRTDEDECNAATLRAESTSQKTWQLKTQLKKKLSQKVIQSSDTNFRRSQKSVAKNSNSINHSID